MIDVAGPPFDAVEREHLADLFDDLGSSAPTLLAPWTARDIAAHLVLREHDYLAGTGTGCPRCLESPRRATTISAHANGLSVARFDDPVGSVTGVLSSWLGA